MNIGSERVEENCMALIFIEGIGRAAVHTNAVIYGIVTSFI
jgi:hypothetical protein